MVRGGWEGSGLGLGAPRVSAEVRPGDEGGERGDSVVVPEDGGDLGAPHGANAGGAERHEGLCEVAVEGVKGDAGEMAALRTQRGGGIFYRPWFDKDDPVQGADSENGACLVDDRPAGAGGAFPEGELIGLGGGEEAGGFPEVGNGALFGWGERGARVAGAEVGHLSGEEPTELGEGNSGVGMDVEVVHREASQLVEEADVAGGVVGGSGRVARDEPEAEPLAVGEEPLVGGGVFGKPRDGGVIAEDDDGTRVVPPVGGQFAGGGDEFAEGCRELGDGCFKFRQAGGRKLDVVRGTEEEAAEDALKCSMGGVAADDVEDVVRRPGLAEKGAVASWLLEGREAAQFAFQEGFQIAQGKRSGIAGEEFGAGGKLGEAFVGASHGGVHALGGIMASLPREQPRGTAPGSRPSR